VEDGKTADNDFSHTLRASYEVSDNINIYATYATGFKASSVNLSRDSRPLASDFTAGVGGSNFAAPSSPVLDAGLAVANLSSGTRFAGPEDATVYELGIKGQFDQFGFNLALFDQTLKGFQSNSFTGTGFALSNAGSQSTKGFEFDTTFSPADPLVFTFAMTYLDAVFDSFPGSSVGDLTGQKVAGVPEISFATSATYTHEFGSSGTMLISRLDYNHDSNISINNGLPTFGPTSQTLHKREVNLVNASMTLVMEHGCELGIWGRNLTEDRFLTTVFDGVAQAGTVSGYLNQPRTYGATARFKF
jgi:outer membrane receptor protein involved in Fe transport